jgi:adenylyl- and sulfurtransferase ThiI
MKSARLIGTYESSILPAESCKAVPYKPVTKAKLEKVLAVEKTLSMENKVAEVSTSGPEHNDDHAY